MGFHLLFARTTSALEVFLLETAPAPETAFPALLLASNRMGVKQALIQLPMGTTIDYVDLGVSGVEQEELLARTGVSGRIPRCGCENPAAPGIILVNRVISPKPLRLGRCGVLEESKAHTGSLEIHSALASGASIRSRMRVLTSLSAGSCGSTVNHSPRKPERFCCVVSVLAHVVL